MKVVRLHRYVHPMKVLYQVEADVITGPCNIIKYPLEAIFSFSGGIIEAIANKLGIDPRSPY